MLVSVAAALLLAAFAVALFASRVPFAHAANAAVFLKVDGIGSGQQYQNHKDDFQIKSFSWEESNKGGGGGGGGGGGKVSMGDFQLSLKTVAASTKFFAAAASGEHFKKMTLSTELPGGDLVSWELADVLVSGYKVTGPDADGNTLDQLAINFKKIIMTYKPSGQAATQAGWDLNKNNKI